MRALLVAMVVIRNPRSNTLQVRSQNGHDQVGLNAKKELNVIQTKNIASTTTMGLLGMRLGSFEITQDTRVARAMIILRGRFCEKPNASRCGFMRENHSQMSTPTKGK